MSGDGDWHALGFNPARGDPSSVGALAKQLTDTGNWLFETYEVLRDVRQQKDTWTGEASKAFVERFGELPGKLDDAHESMKAAGKALSGWRETLKGHQTEAAKLERKAREAIEKAEKADQVVSQTVAEANQPVAYDPSDPEARAAANRRAEQQAQAVASAKSEARSAWDRFESIRKQAVELQETWREDARAVARKLRDATDIAPGFWSALGDAFSDMGDFVVDNLGTIGDVAGMIAAVAGTLSFIPGANLAFGPIALVAGGVALAAHAGDIAANDKWTDVNAWVGVGTDALGMLPMVGPLAKGGAAATDALQVSDGLVDAGRVGAKAFGSKTSEVVTDMAQPADTFGFFGDKLANRFIGAEGMAKTIQGTFNVGTQIPVATDWIYHNDTSATFKDGFGHGSFAGGAAQSYGEWGKVGHELQGLGESLSSFAKALG
ncbi:hypothetical protein SAMN04487905_101477 [Actinopolyspora xinjiangensis]|uniref:Putative T7SS secretion signal domain-containing protein n=1 Tax=Actinopolyspora xinjiangensis TaxID=405564 RepID=A0A1H0PBC4_9ACTN|nr:hypothetical protein [Actinopolyspora xinjiangensis]SDP02392.1 hypothetical protein SAMN04487905_101477 [Actinopolyspora xinjiangensis]